MLHVVANWARSREEKEKEEECVSDGKGVVRCALPTAPIKSFNVMDDSTCCSGWSLNKLLGSFLFHMIEKKGEIDNVAKMTFDTK